MPDHPILLASHRRRIHPEKGKRCSLASRAFLSSKFQARSAMGRPRSVRSVDEREVLKKQQRERARGVRRAEAEAKRQWWAEPEDRARIADWRRQFGADLTVRPRPTSFACTPVSDNGGGWQFFSCTVRIFDVELRYYTRSLCSFVAFGRAFISWAISGLSGTNSIM